MTTERKTTHMVMGHNGTPYFFDHFVDEDGNPAGGYFEGTGIQFKWQDGPVMGTGKPPNGAFVEDGILAVAQRIAWYQGEPGSGGNGRFACEENAIALEHLRLAHEALLVRTRRRMEQNVEGRHLPHRSED